MTSILENEPLPSNALATPKLAGRVAFVTGGTRGIGAAIAHSLASQGATVAVGYSRNRESAEGFVADLTRTARRHGALASAHQGNVGIGITVNTVTPGLIATEMTAGIPDKVMAKITGQIPAGRAGQPEEVARVVHFLAADASSYITGQVWSVNGGMDM